jgi:hypothetical protein
VNRERKKGRKSGILCRILRYRSRSRRGSGRSWSWIIERKGEGKGGIEKNGVGGGEAGAGVGRGVGGSVGWGVGGGGVGAGREGVVNDFISYVGIRSVCMRSGGMGSGGIRSEGGGGIRDMAAVADVSEIDIRRKNICIDCICIVVIVGWGEGTEVGINGGEAGVEEGITRGMGGRMGVGKVVRRSGGKVGGIRGVHVVTSACG